MVQDFVLAAYRWLLSTANVFRHLLPYLLLALIALGALYLALRRLDPETAASAGNVLRRNKSRLRQLALLSLSVLLLCGGLVQARKMVRFRQLTVEEAPASRRYVPELGGIVQYAPRVAVMESRTYTRTLTLPPSYVENIGSEGLQVLSPYLSDPSAENVIRLADTFKRSGRDVLFTRELTRIDEVPISADLAEVKVGFDHRGSASGHRHYEAVFDGEYRFRNPRPEAAQMRFTFPLPQGGGTMQGFALTSGRTRVTEPDQHGEYAWAGTVGPNETVVVSAHYTVTGSRGFAYALGSERRRIGQFHMVAESSEQPRYAKSAIFPTSVRGGASEWRLKDVITAQSIFMLFPNLDLPAQLLDKTLSFLPLILLAFTLAAFLLAPDRAFAATLAFAAGLLGMAVLSTYVSPTLATLAGASVATLSAGLVLKRSIGWAIASAAGLLCLIFLSGEHGALLAWSLALVAGFLALIKPRYLRASAQPNAMPGA